MAHTQVASGGLMEMIEARALANKKARANFYQPDVQYERLTPIMKQYLETVGEQIVVECAKGMAEEAKRANILASMPKNATGYKATERSFELERIREQKIIQKIINERDHKLAKATRFQRHIPPPTNPAAYTDNEDWVNAVMKQARVLGIDPKKEKEYELLPLAAESLEAPLPVGWKMKHGGARAVLKNGYDAHMNFGSGNEGGDSEGGDGQSKQSTRGGGSSSKRNHHSKSTLDGSDEDGGGGGSKLTSKAPLVSYVNKSKGSVLYEHPLNSYYRSITSSRRTASELVSVSSKNQASFNRCREAEDAMRLLMDKMVNPEKYSRINEEDDDDENENNEENNVGNIENNFMRTLQFDNRVSTREYSNDENDVNDMEFTLPSNRLNKNSTQIQNQRRINTALPTTATQRGSNSTQRMSYRESLNLGKRGTAQENKKNSTSLPRVSPHEVGVSVVMESSTNTLNRRSMSRQGGKELSSANSQIQTLPPPSPGMSPIISSNNNMMTKSFKWSDDDEAKQQAFKNYNKNSSVSKNLPRPSIVASQREARRKQAEETDPHTQKVAAPKGYSFEDDIYTTSRKVLPGGFPPPHQDKSRLKTRGGKSYNSKQQSSNESYSYTSQSRSSYTTTSSGFNLKTQEYRPGTTAVSSMRRSAKPVMGTLRKSNSLPNSPTDATPYGSFRQTNEMERTSTPLASFMNDF